MDIPASPILASLVLGLLIIEMGGPYTFEEVLVGHDCPVEAQPYLPNQPLLLHDKWNKKPVSYAGSLTLYTSERSHWIGGS